MKKLLFLGAGPNQLPGIETAVALGYHVTTVDNLPESPGHRRSHRFEPCSTADATGVLAIARRLAIDGIATFASDVAAPTVAHVARTLGLPGGLPPEVARMSHKSEFRRVQHELGLPAPAFAIADAEADLPALAGLHGTLVFKPEDASGSKGISSARADDPAATLAAFRLAQDHARCGRVCIETMLDGLHLAADGRIEGGRVTHIVCTDKQRRGFVVSGHVVPGSIAPPDIASLQVQVETVARHLGLTDGFFDLDAVVTATGPVIVEMSPRLGGNGIPMLLELAAGLRLTEASLRFAMGEPFALTCAARPRAMASWVFGAPRAGTLVAMSDEASLRARVPEVRWQLRAKTIGDAVRPMVHNGDLLGLLVFELPEGRTFDAMTRRIEPELGIEVASP